VRLRELPGAWRHHVPFFSRSCRACNQLGACVWKDKLSRFGLSGREHRAHPVNDPTSARARDTGERRDAGRGWPAPAGSWPGGIRLRKQAHSCQSQQTTDCGTASWRPRVTAPEARLRLPKQSGNRPGCEVSRRPGTPTYPHPFVSPAPAARFPDGSRALTIVNRSARPGRLAVRRFGPPLGAEPHDEYAADWLWAVSEGIRRLLR
jgi:hypothetical protein